MLDPKSPDSFFPAFRSLKDESDAIKNQLLGEAESYQIDTFKFFHDINQWQIELTRSQKSIHTGVRKVEEKWSNTDTIAERNKSYMSAIEYFKQTESVINKTSKQIDKIVEYVAKPPNNNNNNDNN